MGKETIEVFVEIEKGHIAKERQMLGVSGKERIEMFVGMYSRTSQDRKLGIAKRRHLPAIRHKRARAEARRPSPAGRQIQISPSHR